MPRLAAEGARLPLYLPKPLTTFCSREGVLASSWALKIVDDDCTQGVSSMDSLLSNHVLALVSTEPTKSSMYMDKSRSGCWSWNCSMGLAG
eukprot:10328757-Heterocapsa_arctica.AAC.1